MAKTRNDIDDMRGIGAGDEAALARLMDRWQGPVLSYVCRFLGCPPEEARDVAQEVFLRVWAHAGRWKPNARFSTWLFTIVSNLCRNQLRSERRRPQMVELAAESQALLAPENQGPHSLAEAGETAARIQAALAELPENQRAALLLKRVEGLRYREIATVLEVSESAVESLLVRARRSLRKKLKKSAGKA